MEYLHKYISRREYILWTLLFLAVRAALAAPFFFEWFSTGNYSLVLHVFALWGDLCTLAGASWCVVDDFARDADRSFDRGRSSGRRSACSMV